MPFQWVAVREDVALKGELRPSFNVASGKRLHSYGKLPFIVDLPINKGDFPMVILVYQRVAGCYGQ